jgi:hypothetical protein
MHTTRSGRGLGPFTGGQLTIIAVTAILAVALPAGAYAAVSGSNAFVTDRVTGVHAGVSPTTGLATSTSPAIGGLVATVSATPGKYCNVFTPPAGKAFVITGITIDPGGASVGNDTTIFIARDTKDNCTGARFDIAGGSYAVDGSYSSTFTPGLGLPHGQFLDFTVTSSVAVDDMAFFYGYLVPASACAVNCI